MLDCRGMGAVTKRGRKGPVEVVNRKMGGKMVTGYKYGKSVKRKMKGKSC